MQRFFFFFFFYPIKCKSIHRNDNLEPLQELAGWLQCCSERCYLIISLPESCDSLCVPRIATCVLAASRLKVRGFIPSLLSVEFQWEQLMWETSRTNRNLPCFWTKPLEILTLDAHYYRDEIYLRFSLNQRVFGFTWQQMCKRRHFINVSWLC